MGIFTKKKEEVKKEENLDYVKNEVNKNEAPPAPPSPSAPISPGLGNPAPPSNDLNSVKIETTKPVAGNVPNIPVPEMPKMEEDDLFNIDDLYLGLNEPGKAPSANPNDGSNKEENYNDLGNSTSNLDSGNTAIDTGTGLEHLGTHRLDQDKPVFITTEQFKLVLENIDYVKNKVKESSDTYLRLMDIKAEEDIEYENMRKDFQQIEDRLYNIDNILFD